MDQPLGLTVGNFLEVRESAECLLGRGPRDLVDLTVRLTAHMLVLGGIEADLAEAERSCRRRLADGSAWGKFLENVRLQGGDSRVLEDPDGGPRAALIEPVLSPRDGYVRRVDAWGIGLAAGRLGASRARKEDPVLPEVGVQLLRTQGQAVARGQPLCRLHARSQAALDEVRPLVAGAYSFSEQAVEPASRVLEEITDDDLG